MLLFVRCLINNLIPTNTEYLSQHKINLTRPGLYMNMNYQINQTEDANNIGCERNVREMNNCDLNNILWIPILRFLYT